MPITSTHPQYRKFYDRWTRAQDASDGEDAVKERGTSYLPKLEEQTDTDYRAYKTRAVYFNATGRTVDGMSGLINRKKPVIEVPKTIENITSQATMDGMSLSEVAKGVTEGLLIGGRVGILVDRPEMENEPAYLALYETTEITNWREDDDGNLLMVVLKEGYYEPLTTDPYILEDKIRYRELFLGSLIDEAGEEIPDTIGYTQRVWEQNDLTNGQAFVVTREVTPLRNGEPLDKIPFVLLTPKGLGTDVWEPPILDIANINLAHYRNSADIEHGRHLTALPTPWVSGVDASETAGDLPLGSGKAWRLPEGAMTGFLEFSGTGISSLAEGMTEKEAKMAALGARMIEPPRSGVEAAETARIHQAGSNATLADIASAVEKGLETALYEAAEWEAEGAGEDVQVEVNKDFVDSKLQPQELTALVESYLKGGISQDTLMYNLKVGEILPEDRSIEEEMELLEQEQPEAAQDGGAGEIAANQGEDTFEIERDDSGNVVRLRRGQ